MTRRDSIYRLIETSRQIADRLLKNAGHTNRDTPDQIRVQAIRDVLGKLEGAPQTPEMFESRVRSIAVEAVAWIVALQERREQAGLPDRPHLRVVGDPELKAVGE